MAAIHRGIQLPEMFENIVTNLPAPQILECKIVCKEWRDSIEGTKKIREAYLVEPTIKDVARFENVVLNSIDDKYFSAPFYAADTKIRMHNAFWELSQCTTTSGPSEPYVVSKWKVHTGVLKDRPEEFVTTPPCKALAICFTDLVDDELRTTECTVSVKTGIRGLDLLEAIKTVIKPEKDVRDVSVVFRSDLRILIGHLKHIDREDQIAEEFELYESGDKEWDGGPTRCWTPPGDELTEQELMEA